MNKKGFTLIELMIVVAVMGILAAVAIPKFAQMTRKSREAETKGRLGVMRSALSLYYGENGFYPAGPAASNSTLLSDALVPRNISRLPPCHISPYHPITETVQTADDLDFAGADSSCDGEWVYVSNPAHQQTGYIAVECYHTDLKGGVWSGY